MALSDGNIGNEVNCLTPVNNIQADPRFVAASDYRLLSGSPAINTAETRIYSPTITYSLRVRKTAHPVSVRSSFTPVPGCIDARRRSGDFRAAGE